VERFETDGAIDVSRIRQAFVCVERRCLDTDAALVAMGVFDRASNSTDTTVATVKLSLVFIVKKDAHRTPVGTESHGTGDTRRTGWLNCVAQHTFDRLDGMTIQRMGLFVIGFFFVFDGVVAEPAGEEFVAAGSQKNGFALVMGTANVLRVGHRTGTIYGPQEDSSLRIWAKID
jgi:hypothetical protein